MDERLQKALEFSNYRQTLNNQLHQLKVTAETHLTISLNGGHFTIDRVLISFVHMLVQMEQERAVLLDNNQVPVEINNLEEFLEEITSKYFEVTNEYHANYERTRKSRKIQSILDIKD